MPFTLQDLINAGLPATDTDGNNSKAATHFSRELTPAEWQTYLSIADPVKYKMLQAKTDSAGIPNWATWTQAQLTAWCDNNLMTDAAIDGTTLSAALKTNIKALNDFARRSGKMEIAQRDMLLYLLNSITS